VPTWRDLEVFLQTLPRSSTAERMNPYTSTWTGTTDGDGPRTFHLVLLDNGRTDTLADEVGRQALRCIRCSACLNVCPVYERAGGHAYGSVYPGPIGAILSPQLRGTASEIDASLPYASSLCGACYEVCPVAIDIPEVLVHLRERVVEGGPVTREGNKVVLKPAKGHAAERAAMRAARWAFTRPAALRTGQRLASRTRRLHPRTLPGPGKAWSGTRDLPALPAEPFRDWWQRTNGGNGEKGAAK
jgi:L-lactate dehydrogenase complex protein LldF